MNPELVKGADFDGYFGIPIIKKPSELIIPSGITPFMYRSRATAPKEAIGFYEMDQEFADVLISPDRFLVDLKDKIFISPDCSLYRDAPFTVQLANIYRNRAIGFYYQSKGVYVIPQIRWGNALTYTTQVLPEKVAFLGAEKHSIVAIGTYGCIKTKEDKYSFEAGLSSMLETLMPEIVLVYGAMPPCVFGSYAKYTTFVQFPDWTTRMHGGGR